MMNDTETLVKALFWSVLAGFGGAVKYVAFVIRSSDVISNRKFVSMLFANVFISSFCGLMGGLLVKTMTNSETWHMIAAGTFGYLGTQGLDYVILALQKKISLPK